MLTTTLSCPILPSVRHATPSHLCSGPVSSALPSPTTRPGPCRLPADPIPPARLAMPGLFASGQSCPHRLPDPGPWLPTSLPSRLPSIKER
jgi:hypothetical protein